MKKLISIIAIMAICGYSFSQVEVLSNGKVGVGITPSELFHVNGGALKIGNGYSPAERAVNMIKIGDGSYIQIGEWEADDMLSFKANKYNFTNGNVGIGVANPTYPLDVVGNVKFTVRPGTAELELYFGEHVIAPPPSFLGVVTPAIYSSRDKYLYIGRDDRWATKIWSYTVECNSLLSSSDMRLKENIKPVPSLLAKLKEVQSYNYNYTDEFFKSFTPEEKQRAKKQNLDLLRKNCKKHFLNWCVMIILIDYLLIT